MDDLHNVLISMSSSHSGGLFYFRDKSHQTHLLPDDIRDNHPFKRPDFLARAGEAYNTGVSEGNHGVFQIVTQETCCQFGQVRQVAYEHGVKTECEAIATQGWSNDREEFIAGLIAVAVPVPCAST